MSYQYWSWILTAFGLTGFVLAGRKIWWCWYINIACQILWFTYAIVTKQLGFVVAAVVYAVVFSQNAIRWTKEHRLKKTAELIREDPKKSSEWCMANTSVLVSGQHSGHDRFGHVHKCTLIIGRHPESIRVGIPVIEHWCDCGGTWLTTKDES